MRKVIALFVIFIIVGALIALFVFLPNIRKTEPKIGKINQQTKMQITSPAFEQNQKIPEKFTCDGENINPALSFSDIPEGTESLALIVDDPDSPSGNWTHWTVWNIPSDTRQILENSVPNDAMEGITSFGKVGYGGPCPGSGTHRYFFKLYALDSRLSLNKLTTEKDLTQTIEDHILARAELVGLYSR